MISLLSIRPKNTYWSVGIHFSNKKVSEHAATVSYADYYRRDVEAVFQFVLQRLLYGLYFFPVDFPRHTRCAWIYFSGFDLELDMKGFQRVIDQAVVTPIFGLFYGSQHG